MRITISEQNEKAMEAKKAFHALRQEMSDHGVPELSLEEINAEIAKVRENRKNQSDCDFL